MLSIKNLHITVADKPIVQGIDLAIAPGTTHVLMGPNGSGKSSLAFNLMGHPGYQVAGGSVTFKDVDLIDGVKADARARLGLFLAFQHPYEIPGVRVNTFLKESYQAITGKIIEVAAFDALLMEALDTLGLERACAYRNVNEGFSGGEKKRLELVQMLILRPSLAILDEIDSGLDLDALKLVAQALELCKKNNPLFSALVITHYPDLVSLLAADQVHIMQEGKIVCSGDASLVVRLKTEGYDAFSRG